MKGIYKACLAVKCHCQTRPSHDLGNIALTFEDKGRMGKRIFTSCHSEPTARFKWKGAKNANIKAGVLSIRVGELRSVLEVAWRFDLSMSYYGSTRAR